MSYQVLARKWRPKKFEDVIGQKHVTRSLQNALLRNRLGHAYLFTGTRGIGKTSVARIFAKSLRCENLQPDGNPCDNCPNCHELEHGNTMNVLEIDGASHNSVDNIRELIGNVQYLPTSGKYKIYIIDEAHMLSSSAFNAFLKTLEEPPEHVVFLFATTEAHKLPKTVTSRLQRFDFKNATLDDLRSHLQTIITKENITFENDKLIKQLCVQGKGSFRDTLSLLDQVLSFAEDNYISEDTLAVSLGLARTSSINIIVETLLTGDIKTCSNEYRKLICENSIPENIATAILDQIFDIIEEKNGLNISGSANEIIQKIDRAECFWIYESISRDINWSLNSIDPVRTLEIILQKICLRKTFFQTQNTVVHEKKNPSVENNSLAKPVNQPAPKEIKPPEKSWSSFLTHLHEKSPALASNLEQGNTMAPIAITCGQLTVDLGFKSSGKIFLDYLSENEVYQKLLSYLAEYFSCPPSSIDLNLNYVNESSADHLAFQSRAEIKRKAEDNIRLKKELILKNNPMIKEAELLFNSKIEKVIIE